MKTETFEKLRPYVGTKVILIYRHVHRQSTIEGIFDGFVPCGEQYRLSIFVGTTSRSFDKSHIVSVTTSDGQIFY